MAGQPTAAAAIAAALAGQSGKPLILATVEDDGEGGAFVDIGFGNITIADADLAANVSLRQLVGLFEADFHECSACRSRLSRMKTALEALERDGAKPTGCVRGAPH